MVSNETFDHLPGIPGVKVYVFHGQDRLPGTTLCGDIVYVPKDNTRFRAIIKLEMTETIKNKAKSPEILVVCDMGLIEVTQEEIGTFQTRKFSFLIPEHIKERVDAKKFKRNYSVTCLV